MARNIVKSLAILSLGSIGPVTCYVTCARASNPPPGVLCEVKGTPTSAYYTAYTDIPAVSVDDCHAAAIKVQQISGSIFNSDLQLCSPYGTLTSDQFKANDSSPLTYSDFRCYSCNNTCPEMTGVNLFRNGGFDDSSIYYGPWITNTAHDTDDIVKIVSPGHDSPNAIRFQAPGVSLQLMTKKICGNSFYRFSIDYERISNNTTGTIQMWIYSYSQIAIPATNNIWSTFEDYWYSGGEGPEWFIVGTQPYDTISYDNIQLLPVPKQSLQAIANATELMTNGGFETGSFAPWSIVEPPSNPGSELKIISPGLNGSLYALRLLTQSGESISQNITLTPDKHYLATFSYKNHSASEFYLRIRFIGATRPYYANQAVSPSQGGHYVQPFVAHETEVTVVFDILGDCGKTCKKVAFDVDDFSIKEMKSDM